MRIKILLRAWPMCLLLASGVISAQESVEDAAGSTVTSPDIPSVLPSFVAIEFLGVSLWQFLLAFIFILLGFVVKKISRYIFENKVIPLFKRTRIDFDHMFLEALNMPLAYLFLILGFFAALSVLPLPTEEPDVQNFVNQLFKILIAADFIWFFFRLVDMGVLYLGRLAERTDSKLDEQLVPLLRRALKLTVGVVGFLSIMQLLEYPISSLLAGLGIGGLAVALALQDTLANFFGSVFIFLDKPFMVGDIIKIGEIEGVVEDIGFRSTRIRTFPKTLVTIPNKAVAAATVDNLSKRPKRRVLQNVGVTYETNADQMSEAVSAIEGILENDEGVDQEYVVVKFSDFGASSLDIMVLYFTKSVDYLEHAEVKERINLAIMRQLKSMGLSVAFPTRSIYIESTGKKGKNGGPGEGAVSLFDGKKD